MKVFFLLNVFLLLIFGSYEPDLFLSPQSVLQAQIIQVHGIGSRFGGVAKWSFVPRIFNDDPPGGRVRLCAVETPIR